LHARVPILFCDRIRERLVFQILVSIQPLLHLDDLKRIRGSSQGVGEKLIRIKRDRRD
jgi:hypothetical protein